MPALERIRSLVTDLRPSLVPSGVAGRPFDETDLRPNLILLALHASAAYVGPELLPGKSRFADAVAWRKRNARGYVYGYGSRAVVAIAGSNDRDDWRGNLAACPRELANWPTVRVHRGILDHAIACAHALAGLSRILREREVTIVGHSLGGAAALVLPLLALTDSGLPYTLGDARVVTFGSPRVGNHAFATTRLAERIDQVAADGDPIPHLPIAGPLLGYRHPPGLRYLAADGRLVSGPLASAIRAATAATAASLPGPLRRRIACRLRDAAAAHSIASYLDRLSLPLLGAEP